MKEQTKIVSIGQISLPDDTERKEPDLADLPVVALREMVLFPGITFPITMGREATVQTVSEAFEKNIPIGVFCQTKASEEHPRWDSLYTCGVVADVVKIFDMPDGSRTALLSARGKIQIAGPGAGETIPGSLSVKAKAARDTMPRPTDKEFLVMAEEIKTTTLGILREEQQQPDDLIFNIEHVPNPAILVNLVATHAGFPVSQKIEMLKASRVKDRAMKLLSLLAQNAQIAEIKSEIKRKTRRNIEEHQRMMVLQQEFEALREELYGDQDDYSEFKKKAEAVPFPADVRKTFDKELEKLRRIAPNAPDYAVQYNFLQTLVDLPWGKEDKNETDFAKAEAILDSDHFGLEKVKDRILEQLAVMMNNPGGRSPILCLVGAPGVGKTSLGQSVARAMGRAYQRVALGGLHDEAEIRGHRRTYIGAMPGRIMDAVRRSGKSNPVLLLDEIDKTASDYKGDPSSALLEVLDPEQNVHFHDNYVDVDFDLSKVLFIATANTTSTIPTPLLDRMELIDISGYLLEEKVEIARRHLIPRVAGLLGIEPSFLSFEHEALVRMIEGYTAESGVRQLEKQIAKVGRRRILDLMRGRKVEGDIAAGMLKEYLGTETRRPERYEASRIPGVAVGLAWTAAGGEILFIESVFSPGKDSRLTLTGNLGNVMKESAMIALQAVRSHAGLAGKDSEWFDTRQLHVHVPEGAIPKDGPSAGITLAVSMFSALSGEPVRERLAMTGELTLRGKVLPVGGIKEKILAAKRAGISDIVLSPENRRDIEEIPPVYLEGLAFHYAENIEDVFKTAFPGLKIEQ